MRTKVTLALLFLNVALFFFIFYIRPSIDPSKSGEEASRLVLPSAASDVRELEITLGTDTTRLVRRGEQWCIATPIDWPANPFAVSQILTELQSLKHETSFTVASLAQNKLSLADYGLEKPVMTVTVTAAQTNPAEPAPRFTLKVGNTTSVENRLYLLSADGTRIHVVSRSLAESLSRPLDQLRASSLFTIPDFEVRNFTIQPSAAVSARTRIRRDGTKWAMENPVQTRANSTAVRSTLAQLAGLQVDNFISQPLSPELSPSSATSLRITLEGNNRSETLLLGAPLSTESNNPARAYYAQFEWKIDGERKSAIFTVTLPQTLLENLRTAQERLRETRILDLDTNTLAALTLRAPGQPDLILQRLESATPGEGPRWQLVRRIGDAAPTTLPADPTAIKNLIERLTLLNATRFVTDAPGSADLEAWGFNRPERTLIIQSEDKSIPSATSALQGAAPASNAQSVTLELGLGSDRGSKAYARLDIARYIYEVDGEILNQTRPEPRLWRDRRLQELPAGARISALRLTDIQSNTVVAEKKFTSAESTAAGNAAANSSPTVPVETSGVGTFTSPQATATGFGAGFTGPANPATPPTDEMTRSAWAALASSLRSLRARSYIADHYAPNFSTTTGEHTWRYRLAIEITLQTGAGEQVSTQTLDLSERLGGTLTIAGSSDLDTMFELEQSLVDALWTLLYTPSFAKASEGTPSETVVKGTPSETLVKNTPPDVLANKEAPAEASVKEHAPAPLPVPAPTIPVPAIPPAP